VEIQTMAVVQMAMIQTMAMGIQLVVVGVRMN
jgi:hypothetical protein